MVVGRALIEVVARGAGHRAAACEATGGRLRPRAIDDARSLRRRPRPRADRVRETPRRQIVEEARWRLRASLAPDAAHARMRDHEPLAGTRDRDVREAALLLESCVRARALAVAERREDSILHAGEKHDRPLEALRDVDRHQHDLLGRGLIARRRERDPFEKAGHPLRGRWVGALVLVVGLPLLGVGRCLGGAVVRIRGRHLPGAAAHLAGSRLVVEIRRSAHELGQVVEAIARLRALLGFELRAQPGAVHDLDDRLGDRRALGDDIVQAIDELDEALQLLARRGTEPRHVTARREASRIQEPRPTRPRRRPQSVDRRLADPAGRHVDDALERGVRRVVPEQAQVRDHVLHLLALEERHRADHLGRDARRSQVLLEHARLCVGPVEDRDVRRRVRAVVQQAPDRLRDEVRLAALVARLIDLERLAGAAVRPQRLHVPVDVLLDDAVRRVEDRLRRAIVLLELHDVRVREVAVEVEQVTRLGAAPGVDRLIVVTHDRQVARRGREVAHEVVLHTIRVLELVDEHLPEHEVQPGAGDLVAEEAQHLQE